MNDVIVTKPNNTFLVFFLMTILASSTNTYDIKKYLVNDHSIDSLYMMISLFYYILSYHSQDYPAVKLSNNRVWMIIIREEHHIHPVSLFHTSNNNKERFTLKSVQEKELRSPLPSPLLPCHGSTCTVSQASVTSVVSVSQGACSAQFVAGILIQICVEGNQIP
jgi:hypothetical protein